MLHVQNEQHHHIETKCPPFVKCAIMWFHYAQPVRVNMTFLHNLWPLTSMLLCCSILPIAFFILLMNSSFIVRTFRPFLRCLYLMYYGAYVILHMLAPYVIMGFIVASSILYFVLRSSLLLLPIRSCRAFTFYCNV